MRQGHSLHSRSLVNCPSLDVYLYVLCQLGGCVVAVPVLIVPSYEV